MLSHGISKNTATFSTPRPVLLHDLDLSCRRFIISSHSSSLQVVLRIENRSRDSSVSTVTTTWTTEEAWFDFEQEQAICLFSESSRPACGSHPASYSMHNRGRLSGGKAVGGVKLSTDPPIVSKQRMNGTLLPLPCVFGK